MSLDKRRCRHMLSVNNTTVAYFGRARRFWRSKHAVADDTECGGGWLGVRWRMVADDMLVEGAK